VTAGATLKDFLMLIAIMATLLVVMLCGRSPSVSVDFHRAQDAIKKDVSDETRKKQALDIVGEMEKTTKESAKEQRENVNELQQVLNVRRAGVLDIQSAMEPLVDKDHETAEKLLDLRFKLKTVLTPDEWAEVFPAPGTMPSGAAGEK
jgi:hypothetical protein